MSPNMQVKRWLKALVNQLTKRAIRRERYKKPAHKHHIGSHAESVYIWTLLGVGAETSQEMRVARNDRRTNGFNSVQMTIGTEEVA